jgi:hypothetical protein
LYFAKNVESVIMPVDMAYDSERWTEFQLKTWGLKARIVINTVVKWLSKYFDKTQINEHQAAIENKNWNKVCKVGEANVVFIKTIGHFLSASPVNDRFDQLRTEPYPYAHESPCEKPEGFKLNCRRFAEIINKMQKVVKGLLLISDSIFNFNKLLFFITRLS